MFKSLKQMPVGRRMTIFGGGLAAMMLAIGLIGVIATLVILVQFRAYSEDGRQLQTTLAMLQDTYQTELAIQRTNATSIAAQQAILQENLEEVAADLAALVRNIGDQVGAPEMIAEATALREAVATGYDTYIRAIVDGLPRDTIAGLRESALNDAAELSLAVDRLKDQLEADLAVSSVAKSRTVLATMVILAVLSLAAVTTGWFVARRIGRDLSEEVAQIVAETQTLARGDLSVAITGEDRVGELGDLARALLVFRDNALEAKRLEAEARQREADLRAQEERQAETQRLAEEKAAQAREAARRATITDLADNVGAVVKAAAAGDFSRRIDAGLSDPELDEMASAINTLVGNVETAMSETARVMAALSDGDLTNAMDGRFQGIFERLQNDVNGSIQRLNQTVTEIMRQCDGVAEAAGTMRERSNELARRAEQQAASLEETSANMEEIRQSVRSSTDGAANAADFAGKAARRVEDAAQVVSSAVQAMGEISDASKRIGDIVSVIDGIAFQTNLLALNAGVEAARAGETGRGFAVVASEVRALAQRSGEASKDIRGLIEASAAKVSDGVALVEETGRSLTDILSSVTQMAQIMQSLTQTAEEQAGNISDVTDVVGRLDTITQKNASLADATSSTAAAMQEKVDAMRRVLAAFRTDQAQGDALTFEPGPRQVPDRFAAE